MIYYGFTGRYKDVETGLWYFRARYFSDELGRFISRDPLGFVDGMSLYAGYFAAGFGLDPSGLFQGSQANIRRNSNRRRQNNNSNSGSSSDRCSNEDDEYQGSLLGKIWNSPNTAIGLALGLVGTAADYIPFVGDYEASIGFGNNAIEFENYPWGNGGMTWGNSILYGNSTPERIVGPYPEYADQAISHPLGDHEIAHTYQSEVLGPLFLPVYLGAGLFSGENIFNNPISGNNPFEHAADDHASGNGSWWPW